MDPLMEKPLLMFYPYAGYKIFSFSSRTRLTNKQYSSQQRISEYMNLRMFC